MNKKTQKIWGEYWSSESVIKRLKDVNTTHIEVVKLLLSLSNKNSNCIELGCGSGTYAIEMTAKGRNFIGSDYSQEALDLTKIRGRYLYNIDVPTKLVDIYNIPYPDNTFDLVFSDGVVEHLDIPKAMKEIKRVIKPNGWAITKIPNANILYKIIYWLLSSNEVREYEDWSSQEEWKQKMIDAKYKNVEISKCGSALISAVMRILKMKDNKYLPNWGKIHFLIKAQK